MDKLTMSNGLYIKLRFRGPTNTRGAQFTATWKDYDGTTIRRVFPYDHSGEAKAAETAVAAFKHWLENARDKDWLFEVTGIATAYVDGEETAIIASYRIAGPKPGTFHRGEHVGQD